MRIDWLADSICRCRCGRRRRHRPFRANPRRYEQNGKCCKYTRAHIVRISRRATAFVAMAVSPFGPNESAFFRSVIILECLSTVLSAPSLSNVAWPNAMNDTLHITIYSQFNQFGSICSRRSYHHHVMVIAENQLSDTPVRIYFARLFFCPAHIPRENNVSRQVPLNDTYTHDLYYYRRPSTRNRR